MNLFQTFNGLIILGILLSCAPKKTEKPNSLATESTSLEVSVSEEQFRSSAIMLAKQEERNVSGLIKANGTLDVPPQNLVTISAPLGGFVKTTELLQGMKVRKGQVVAILEHPDYIQLQEDYLSNKSQLEYSLLEYTRQQQLAVDNVNAAKSLQQSKSNYFISKAKAEGLAARLKMINIDPIALENGTIQNTVRLYSPIEGYVTQVNVNIGMHVNPTDVMFRIVDTEHLHAEAQVFEKDVSRLKVGQTVRLMLSNDLRERRATVYLIGKEITQERTVRVHCHLDQEDPTLIPGMYFSAVIETNHETVPTLPDQAIITYEGKKYVFIQVPAQPLRFEMVEIKCGVSENGFTAVTLPEKILRQSSPIVVHGAYELLSKLKNNYQE